MGQESDGTGARRPKEWHPGEPVCVGDDVRITVATWAPDVLRPSPTWWLCVEHQGANVCEYQVSDPTDALMVVQKWCVYLACQAEGFVLRWGHAHDPRRGIFTSTPRDERTLQITKRPCPCGNCEAVGYRMCAEELSMHVGTRRGWPDDHVIAGLAMSWIADAAIGERAVDLVVRWTTQAGRSITDVGREEIQA